MSGQPVGFDDPSWTGLTPEQHAFFVAGLSIAQWHKTAEATRDKTLIPPFTGGWFGPGGWQGVSETPRRVLRPAPRKPTIGAIVWYNDVDSVPPLAAIVTAVHGADNSLTSDMHACLHVFVTAYHGWDMRDDVLYGAEPGQWRWPD